VHGERKISPRFLVGLGAEVGEREQRHRGRYNVTICTKRIWRVSCQEKGENDIEFRTEELGLIGGVED